jgi:hypothetical protein
MTWLARYPEAPDTNTFADEKTQKKRRKITLKNNNNKQINNNTVLHHVFVFVCLYGNVSFLMCIVYL